MTNRRIEAETKEELHVYRRKKRGSSRSSLDKRNGSRAVPLRPEDAGCGLELAGSPHHDVRAALIGTADQGRRDSMKEMSFRASTTSTITGKRVRPRRPKKDEKSWEDVQKYFQEVDEEILAEETPIKRIQNQTLPKRRSLMNDVSFQVPRELSVAEILEMYPSIHQEYEEYKSLIGMSPIPLKDFARTIVSKLRKHCPLVPRALLLEDAEKECTDPNVSCM